MKPFLFYLCCMICLNKTVSHAANIFPANQSSLSVASESFDNTPFLLTSSDQESQLLQILETVDQMEDSQAKAILLNEVSQKYITIGEIEKANQILDQSLMISNNIANPSIRLNLLTKIAEQYAQIDQLEKSKEILQLTSEIANSVEDKLIQGQLLLEIALSYQAIGLEDEAQTLIDQSQTIITEANQPIPDFPFTEMPKELRLGLGANVNSFRDTTAFLGVSTDFYKQWPVQDLSINGSVSISFDDSRSVNNYRPSGLIYANYHRHFNQKWSAIADLFVTTNQNFFSSRNESEDLSIAVSGIVGAGLNLWRGESPREIVDIQFGLGSRYEYDFIDFEERRNQVNPIAAIVLVGRGFQVNNARIEETFAIIPALNDLEDLIVFSDTRVSFPISQRWSYTNRLFIQYRNKPVYEGNPDVEFFFTTGVDYRF
ncbi:MAG: DUF481 domain-containing protein [Microcystaceae cyanobacterium]